MTSPFMRAYSLLLIKTCHRRGAFAMGGMAAQIPIKNDPAANEQALAKVRTDKEREANDGHDGTWVAHPGLVAIAKEAFDKVMKTPNQIQRQRDDVNVAASDLLDFQPKGPITEQGLAHQHQHRHPVHRRLARRHRLRPDLQPDGRRRHRRDLARADLAMDPQPARQARRRPQSHQGTVPGTGATGARAVREILGEQQYGAGKYAEGAKMFEELTLREDFVEFLTLPAYDYLIAHEHR